MSLHVKELLLAERRSGQRPVVLFAYHLAAFVRIQSGCRPEVIK